MEIYIKNNDNSFEVMTKEEVISYARSILEERFGAGAEIREPTAIVDYLTIFLYEKTLTEREVVAATFLSTANRIIESEVVYTGALDQCTISSRNIVKRMLELNAKGLILSHNHPSGSLTPSESDKKITAIISQALALFGMKLLDHIIIGKGYYSFNDHMLLP